MTTLYYHNIILTRFTFTKLSLNDKKIQKTKEGEFKWEKKSVNGLLQVQQDGLAGKSEKESGNNLDYSLSYIQKNKKEGEI